MAALSALDEIIQNFVQDPNLVRIKKLLIYACTNAWETNSAQISTYNLPDLIERLMAIDPTVEALEAHLGRVVKTLNKPAEYQLIANLVIRNLKKLYSEPELTQVVVDHSPQYQAIAQVLEQDVDAARVKKLLYCACKGQWENSPTILEALSLSFLIQEIYELTPSLENLQSLLQSIVRTLNRQAVYTLVAQKTVAALKILYLPDGSAVALETNPPTLSGLSASEPSAHPQEQTDLPELEVRRSFPTGPTESMAKPRSETPLPADAVALAHPQPNRFDPSVLFNLRLEVVQYANPLRAKILIFSIVRYHLEPNEANDSALKAVSLDDLLILLFQKFSSWPQLQAALEGGAHSFAQSRPYLQVAAAISRAMRPFYPDSTSAIAFDLTTQAGHLDHLPSQAQSAADFTQQLSPFKLQREANDDNTCQFFAPPLTHLEETALNGTLSGASSSSVSSFDSPLPCSADFVADPTQTDAIAPDPAEQMPQSHPAPPPSSAPDLASESSPPTEASRLVSIEELFQE